LTTAPPPVWSDATLAGLSALDPAQAVDRLSAAISHDLTGLLARVHSPEASAAPSPAVEHRPQGAEQAAPIEPRTPRSERAGVFAGTGERIRQLLKPIQGGFSRLATWLTNWLNRMAPGLADPPAGTVVSTRLLAATAIVVPLIIVTIAAVVYLGRGRRDQFDEYVVQAAAAIQVAQLKGDPREARKDWESALRFLQQANEYGSSAEATSMRQQAQAALDSLDLILRLEFKPVVSGGFGSDANLTAIAASATDLYIFDEAERTIWHAWGAPERGYKIDSTFECLEGRRKFQELGSLVDIVLQTSPGALGTEGVVAVDVDGNLLYCAPEREPALAKLTAPDIGFGRIQAVDVQNDQLFVMDSVTNAVWIYSAVGGLFSGNPELYFVEEVRELGGAIDIAMAGDELFILYADGKLDRCRRFSETDPDGNPRIRVECEADPRFQDERPDHEASNRIPGAVPAKLEYSPPPEPSLFFLDTFNNGVFHYSLRLVYQGLYLPLEPFAGEISALTMGPPNDLYLAVGGQVYHTAVIR
jgi:hypothetical protein